jgi:hypothetical protein
VNIKKVLLVAAALACVALGFFAARQIERMRYADRVGSMQEQHDRQLTELRAAGEQWADAVAREQGAAVLRAFVAGISPAVLAGRREGIELAAVSLLHVPGIAGIHVLGLDGAVLYSSDAKLVATGEAEYRGAWALQVAELTSRPSTRPGVIDMAVPIASAGKPLAVAWMEYDAGAVREAARPTGSP